MSAAKWRELAQLIALRAIDPTTIQICRDRALAHRRLAAEAETQAARLEVV